MASAQLDQTSEIARHGDRSASSLASGAGAATGRAVENGNGNGASLTPKPQAQDSQDRRPLFSDDEGDDDDDNASEASIPSDQHQRHQQSQLNPRNGISGTRARPISTASAESVLPPGAITLQDNEREDSDEDEPGRRSNSSELYGRDRNRACWARSVQVTDYVMVNGSTTNIGAFVVWNIRVETLSGTRINIRKRYSEFDDLRRKLVQTFPSFEAAVPALPPKSVLKRFQPRFLEKRRAGLQYFLNCILLNPEFSGSPVLKEFLFS
ncbi:hypothetical protein VTJ49DRAFT_6895 [Mycothermus thermophilus]|uniref:Endosomal/vacuolar adapter protein YPT35 n=1 Tax=Humicola insolens TaxID=85995 RepID=A0ABR3VJM9_HUMIN